MPQPDLNRREFLVLATMGSAALLLGGRGLAATSAPGVRSYAALEPLPLGAIKPAGWLRGYLRRQAEGLGANLERVSWPFTEPYWKGATQGESWWPWEQKAYWVDGAARLAVVLDDEPLKRQVAETIDYTLAHIDPDGYLGPDFFKDPKPDFHRWPHALFFRGLEATSGGESGVVEAMRRHYLSDRADYGKPTRNVVNVESILWCYERTGDPALLAKAERAWADYLTVAADPEHGDLGSSRVFANVPINAHGVTYMETAKQPAILFNATGKREYLDFALAAQRRAFDHHMLVDGIPSTSEWFRGVTSLDMHETCCITDCTWSWGYLMMATGDGAWGDRIERACFNAGPGAIKNDWRAVQYFSGPNQFLATLNSDHGVMEHGGRMMAYQPNPGQHTACCGGNVHRLLPNYVARMWMRRPDGGLAATLYGPSKLATTVGAGGVPVEITQVTDYPFDERIHLEIQPKAAVAFPLALRIPEWCDAPRLEVNGKRITIPPVRDGFATLKRTFQPGDTVTLTLPMRVAATHWPENGVALEHGPLVYSLPIEAAWSPVVEPRYTTADFPSWNATPTTPWNYGLALDLPKLAREVTFERRPVGDDPWTNPPTTLKVPAQRIEGWELRQNPRNPNQRFTPPLPPMDDRKASAAETITLVPYGATHLRLTIFPVLPEG